MNLIGQLSIPTSPVNQAQIIACEICGKDSSYSCYNCQKANYCSKEHQKDHWKVHKTVCNKNSNAQSQKVMEIQKQILEARKNYYENYSNKIFNQCLLDAKLMTGLSKSLLALDPSSIAYQLEYGASVSVIVRTYWLLKDLNSAKHQMQNYLSKHNSFLYDIDKYKKMIENVKSMKQQDKQELQSKLNLISGIGNLCYVIGMNTEEYYVLYTKYVITCFGEDSYEASNCYFLLGTFYSEEGWFNKAIACFEKSAKIRGQFAGDCMFNIGVLHKLMGNLPKALQTLQVSMKLREQQYGEDSNEVAEVNELMGSIYTDLNDFKTAFAEFQKAFLVRSSNTLTPQYQNILDLIHDLYDKLCLYIKMGQPNMKRPEIYTHLRSEIKGDSSYWEHPKYRDKRSFMDEENNEKEEVQTVEKYKKKKTTTTVQDQRFSWKNSGLFNITQSFVQTLNLSQLFRLSELQLELQNCESVFSLVYIVGTSLFFESLRPQKKIELEKQNARLFELMKLEDIKRMKHKDK